MAVVLTRAGRLQTTPVASLYLREHYNVHELPGNGDMGAVLVRATNFISEKMRFRLESTNFVINVFPLSKHHVKKA
jgi:hypothetical protein